MRERGRRRRNDREVVRVNGRYWSKKEEKDWKI
jgi:hypothetical protein